ncbi:FecCD family ABC transporter permease [Treponema pedis]|uniref:FecCD family ABC transporter permease n=1 Tax=Treponema pedis TaxID=409322 RepID=UPI00197F1494|nr:iron ABC transporter permease [Treponema pedis]QSI04182.1 iron ABC transporter permease [Treponema pedis]
MTKKTSFNFWLILSAVSVLIFCSVSFGTLFGSADLAFKDVFKVFQLKLFGKETDDLSLSSIYIVWNLRMPRVLLAFAAGGGLAICGAAMQSVTQNILADPYILGISSGASAAVSVALFLGVPLSILTYGLPVFAFAGACIALVFVYSLGMAGRTGSSARLVLAGIAVSVVLNAFTQLFMMLAPSDRIIRNLLSWMMGSLASARWNNILFPCVCAIAGSLVFLFFARAFNVISLGDETAISLGIHTGKLKKITTLTTAMITGVSVSACGIIGFVGFIIPHIVRLLIGCDHRKLFPLSFLTGGLFLIWMDILARTLLSPQELPVGIFTALCGGPFFIWLLRKQIK